MEFFLQSFWESLQMIVRLDRELLSALATTLKVSTTSTVIASSLALPLGFLIARHEFPGKLRVVAMILIRGTQVRIVVPVELIANARNNPLIFVIQA